jgi:hypothetical protein
MKTFFNWLLVAVCLFTVGNAHVMASNEEKKEEVKTVLIPITTGEPVHGDDQRNLVHVPFTAYYQIREYSFITDYNHFNWGWNGSYNGYFSSGVFNPSQGYQYDESYGPSNLSFDDRMFIYTNIRKQ